MPGSRTAPLPTSTSGWPRPARPTTDEQTLCPTTRPVPTCGSWLQTTDACWGTGCAPVQSPSTARSSRRVSAATSSRPDRSSSPSSDASGTTPPNTVRKTESSSSIVSSRTSTGTRECGSMNLSPGPVDHPCNNTSGIPHGEVPGGPCKSLLTRSLALSLSCEQRNHHHGNPRYQKEEWCEIVGPRRAGQQIDIAGAGLLGIF